MTPYIADLGEVINMEAIRQANLHIGVDPLGGAAVAYWQPIAQHYGLNIEVVNTKVDPAFGFMTLDHDGKIRMDCSSPYAMASLVALKDRFDIAWGNDADVDRHGIVTPSIGLMNPNHFLAVAINYLLSHRPQWPTAAKVGKTLVSSSLIDRVVNGLGRRILEVPVGFKWFSAGLLDGSICFGGEESAGASFLRLDGSVGGRPTRMALSSACWPPKSPPLPARTQGATIRNWLPATARRTTSVLMPQPARHRRPPSSN